MEYRPPSEANSQLVCQKILPFMVHQWFITVFTKDIQFGANKSSPHPPTSFFKNHFHGGGDGGNGLHSSGLLGSAGW